MMILNFFVIRCCFFVSFPHSPIRLGYRVLYPVLCRRCKVRYHAVRGTVHSQQVLYIYIYIIILVLLVSGMILFAGFPPTFLRPGKLLLVELSNIICRHFHISPATTT